MQGRWCRSVQCIMLCILLYSAIFAQCCDSAIVPALVVFRRCNSSPQCTSGRVGLGLGGEICCSLPLHHSGHPFLSAWANLHKDRDEENNYGKDDEDEDNDDLLVNNDMPLPPYRLILHWLEWQDDDYDDDNGDEGKLLTKRLGLGASRSRNGRASRVPTLYSTTRRTKSQNCKTAVLLSARNVKHVYSVFLSSKNILFYNKQLVIAYFGDAIIGMHHKLTKLSSNT